MSTYQALRDSLEAEERAILFTFIGPSDSAALGSKLLLRARGEALGTLGSSALDSAASSLLEEAGDAPATGAVMLQGGEEPVEVFVDVFNAPAKLVIVGAVHVAIHLVHFAKRLGFRCIVVDAREVFATEERFPHADELIVGWPAEVMAEMPIHDNTYCVYLTHDPKLDNPALQVALERGARYVGALGSKRTHAKRVAELGELGVTAEDIDKIHAPIGIHLGGRRPEEIALSIVAQLVQARYRTGH